MKTRHLALVLIGLLMASHTVWSATAKGRIKYISNKANTVQIDVKEGEPVVVRFDAGTAFEGVESIDGLGPEDLIVAEYEPGMPATKIKKVVFGLPPGVEIDIQEMLAILQGQRGAYVLGDGRPTKKYLAGHVPSAISTPPKEVEDFKAKMPEDKGQLVVFYCGGPTCPFTGQAVELAQSLGYTNVKGFQAGLPGWKKAKLPVHTNRGWMAKNLDEHHVVLDVREAPEGEHLPGAVGLASSRIAAMTQRFIDTQEIARLPAVSDMGAPIVLYGDTHSSKDVLLAFKELRSWGYSNVSVLEGGLTAWMADDLPIASGALAADIHYTKQLAKGAIAPKEFAALEKIREQVVFVDVRSEGEVAAQGKLRGAMHIPLDSLEGRLSEIPEGQEVITYCENGIRAEMAYELLREKGYKVRFLNETITFDGDGQYKL